MPWVLVSPDYSETVDHKMYFLSYQFDEIDGPVFGVVVTRHLEDAVRFDTKRDAMDSAALDYSTFVAEEVEE